MAYLLAALLGGFFVFNSQASPEKVESALVSVLQSRFPGSQVKVNVEGKSGRNVVKGRFQKGRVEMSNFTLGSSAAASTSSATGSDVQNSAGSGLNVRVAPKATGGRVAHFEMSLRDFRWNELSVQNLDLTMDNVAFDWKKLRKTSVLWLSDLENGRATAQVPAASLASFVTQKLPDLQNTQVVLLPQNQVRITATRPAPIVNLPVSFELKSGLEVRGARELWLTNPKIEMGGVPLAAPLTNALLRNVNPVYVLDAQNQWPLRVQVQNLKTDNNALQIVANVSLNRTQNTPVAAP